MEVKCVYCGCGIKACDDTEGISHGICNDCLPNVLQEFDIPLTAYLELVPYPAMLVDEDGEIVGANEQFREKISTLPDSQNEILNAGTVNSKDAQGDEAEKEDATIGGIVRKTRDTGKDVAGMHAEVDVKREDGSKHISLLVGTHRIGRNVIVGLENLPDSSV